MGRTNSRGQSIAELLIVLLLLSALVLGFVEYSNFEVFRGTRLSQEAP